MLTKIASNSSLAILLGGRNVSEIWVADVMEHRHNIMTMRPIEKFILRLLLISMLIIGSGFRQEISFLLNCRGQKLNFLPVPF